MDHRMRVFSALLHVMLLTWPPIHAFVAGADGPVTHQEALEGGNTTLLCDTSPDTIDDDLMLIVWYKDNDSIYSFDARINSEWSSSSYNTNGRLSIDLKAKPTSMKLSALREDDQALYHCRVEFLLSPTRYTGVNLTVVVLPSQPFFLDELGNKVENKTGPFYEGDTLVLNCLVIGGRPQPRISWYSGDVLVDASDSVSDIPNVRQNELYLPLARNNVEGLSCKASNTQLVAPMTASIEIELYLSAENVTIHWAETTRDILEVGKPVMVQCTAYGSYPSPDLAWWLDHKHLTQHSNQTWDYKTRIAVSFLQLIPTVADNQATLACVAKNSAMPPGRNSKADVITLNVTFPPIVEIIKLGNGKLNQVVELDPFNLECEVKANPPADKIIWYFNDMKIEAGNIWGNEVTTHKLLVEEATRKHAGQYSCVAKNSINETKAESINITVNYPPECTGHGITLNQETLKCDTKALPPPDTFYWHIQQDDTETQHLTTGSPSLPLTQVSGPLMHLLSIACEAENGIASQEKPCKKSFNLKHLRPQQPQQCDLAYEHEQFQIRCMPVENATHYEVSVWRLSTTNASLILENRRSMDFGSSQALARNADHWLIKEGLGVLNAGDEAGAAACNRYGCSAAVLLRPSENLLQAASPPWWKFFLDQDIGITVGVVMLLMLFVGSTALAVCIARKSRSKPPAPVIQVLQLDDVTRDFLDSAGDLNAHASCSLRSCSTYSNGADEPTLTDWRRHREWEPPPDVTLTLHRESAV